MNKITGALLIVSFPFLLHAGQSQSTNPSFAQEETPIEGTSIVALCIVATMRGTIGETLLRTEGALSQADLDVISQALVYAKQCDPNAALQFKSIAQNQIKGGEMKGGFTHIRTTKPSEKQRDVNRFKELLNEHLKHSLQCLPGQKPLFSELVMHVQICDDTHPKITDDEPFNNILMREKNPEIWAMIQDMRNKKQ